MHGFYYIYLSISSSILHKNMWHILHAHAKWLFTKLEENIIKKYEEDDYLLKLWSRVCGFV